eukprot:scaffold6334_cov137-Isochrysis_galbana.AAC.10
MGGWRVHRVIVEARHAIDALLRVVDVGGEVARDRATADHRIVPTGVGEGAHSSDLEVLAFPREVVRAFGRTRGGGWARGGGGEEAEESGDRAGGGFFGALRAGALAGLCGRPILGARAHGSSLGRHTARPAQA